MRDVPAEDDGPSGRLELRHASTARSIVVTVPNRRLLAIEGAGERWAADFRRATTILRTVEDALRAQVRADGHDDPGRAILEIVWRISPESSSDEIVEAFSRPTTWHWRQMIEIPTATPDAVADEAIELTREQAARDIPLVRLVAFAEGRAAQVLHIGGRQEEPSSVGKLFGLVAESGLRPAGDLHQLVLADPDVVPRDRGRSIFRVPVEGQQLA
jgi:hypothetical protein